MNRKKYTHLQSHSIPAKSLLLLYNLCLNVGNNFFSSRQSYIVFHQFPVSAIEVAPINVEIYKAV